MRPTGASPAPQSPLVSVHRGEYRCIAVTAICKKKIDLILQIKGAFRCGLATGRPLTFRPSDARRAVDNRTPRIGPED